MTPPALSEEEASDFALHSLVQAFRRIGAEAAGIDRTHLVKAVFKLADEFELPITRCWFKFGQFVLSDRVTSEGFARVRDSGIGALSQRLSSDLRDLFVRMRTFSETLVPFFSEPLNDFLPEYYEREAPDLYRGIYTTNFALVSFCRRLADVDFEPGQRTHFSQNAGPHVTKFHRAAAPIIADADARTLVLEYTSFLEELVIRFDVRMADSEFDLRGWKQFFVRATDGYVDHIWTLPAAQIAADTVVGPRGEEEKEAMLHTASLADRYRREHFHPIKQEAEEKGYLPAPEDLGDLVAGARERAATRAPAIEELSHLIRKGD